MECRQPDILDECVDVMLEDNIATVSALDGIKEEIDAWINKGISPSINPQILPDGFYTVNSKRHFKDLFWCMELKYKDDFSLNWIDVSKLRNMSELFSGVKCSFDISRWDVSGVVSMEFMFYKSAFNSDISRWDVSNVKLMEYMFAESGFNRDISGWKIRPDVYRDSMYHCCPIKKEFKAW